jgi:hypothetical protein
VIYNKHFTILPEKRKKKKERKSIKETLEKTEGAIKNGQSRENRRGNQEWTIQRNWQDWVHKTQDEDKQNKNQHNMICVSL